MYRRGKKVVDLWDGVRNKASLIVSAKTIPESRLDFGAPQNSSWGRRGAVPQTMAIGRGVLSIQEDEPCADYACGFGAIDPYASEPFCAILDTIKPPSSSSSRRPRCHLVEMKPVAFPRLAGRQDRCVACWPCCRWRRSCLHPLAHGPLACRDLSRPASVQNSTCPILPILSRFPLSVPARPMFISDSLLGGMLH